MRHTAGRVPPPSESTPGVPRELDAVVARATEPDPLTERFAVLLLALLFARALLDFLLGV